MMSVNKPFPVETDIQFEDYVCAVLLREIGWNISRHGSRERQIWIGENIQGIEIKFQKDFLNKYNGWLYFEVQAKDNWRVSGNYIDASVFRHLKVATDNTLIFAVGNEKLFYLFTKTELQDIYNSGAWEVKEIKQKTSIGFCLPKEVSDVKCFVKFEHGAKVLMNRDKNTDIRVMYRP